MGITERSLSRRNYVADAMQIKRRTTRDSNESLESLEMKKWDEDAKAGRGLPLRRSVFPATDRDAKIVRA